MMQCIDCVYYRPASFNRAVSSACNHPVVDPVGEGASPMLERGPFGACNPEGIYFTRRANVKKGGFFHQLWQVI